MELLRDALARIAERSPVLRDAVAASQRGPGDKPEREDEAARKAIEGRKEKAA